MNISIADMRRYTSAGNSVYVTIPGDQEQQQQFGQTDLRHKLSDKRPRQVEAREPDYR